MVQTLRVEHNSQRFAVFARRSAAVGFVGWLLMLLAVTTDSHETELIHKIVFFAFLVIVPLGAFAGSGGDEQGKRGFVSSDSDGPTDRGGGDDRVILL